MLLIGCFEVLDSQRGIAWRCADSLGCESEQAAHSRGCVAGTMAVLATVWAWNLNLAGPSARNSVVMVARREPPPDSYIDQKLALYFKGLIDNRMGRTKSLSQTLFTLYFAEKLELRCCG